MIAKNSLHSRWVRTALAASSLLAAGAALAAPPADLDAEVARTMEAFGAPGLALTVVENGATVVAKGYGLRELGKPARNDEHTIFPIGSCTKAFVGAALALLVDEGKLRWEDRVVDHLPGFRLYDPYATAEITVRDLLVHRSGLGLGAGDLLWLGGANYNRKELIAQLRHIKPATSFRSGYAYDNVLYAVAGQVIEEVSGQTWEEFTRQRLLLPLGMRDSVVPFPELRKVKNRAALHARTSGPLRGRGPQSVLRDDQSALSSTSVAPAGSIYSSAADMAQWLKVQLAQGLMENGKPLYSEKQAREMWTGVVVLPPDSLPAVLDARKPSFGQYALGWVIEDYRGHKVVTHTGGVFGGAAIVMLLPEKKVGLSIMVNSEDGAVRRALTYRLLDHYLGLPAVDWTARYQTAVNEIFAKGEAMLAKLPAEAGSGPGPSLPLEKYAGTYRDAWYGTVSIRHDAGRLHLQFDRTPSLRGPLEHVRHDTFRTRFTDRNIEDTYITFALKADGSIDQAKMKAVSPLADFSFNYHDLLLLPEASVRKL